MLFPYLLRLILASVIVSHVAPYLTATTLVVGADIDYAPFSYISDGEPTGFDVELCDLVAEELGVTVRYDLRPWAEVHDLARTGEIDVVLGVVYTAERDRYLDFTCPYNTFRFALLAHQDSDIRTVEDLHGRQLAHLDGDVVAPVLMNNSGVEPHYVSFPTLSEAVHSVNDEATDGVITPYEWAQDPKNDQLTGGLHMVTEDALVSTYRMGVTQAQPDLVEQLEPALRKVMATTEYAELREKWFGPHETDDTSVEGRQESKAGIIALLLAAIIIGGLVLFVVIERRTTRL